MARKLRPPLFNRRPLQVESLEQRAVLAVTPFTTSFPAGPDVELAVVDDEVRIVGLGGNDPIVTKLNLQGQVAGTLRLGLPDGYHYASLTHISQNGRYVEGAASNSVGNSALGAPAEIFIWDLNDPEHPLNFEDTSYSLLFRTEFRTGSPATSFGGLVAAYGVPIDGGQRIEVSIKGVSQPVTTADGQPLVGDPQHLENWIGGDPTRWLLTGTGIGSQPFIAFSGEPAMQLGEFVAQQSQHDDSVFAPEVWKMAVGADSVFIVSRMFTSNCDGGSGECQGLTLAGYNVTGLPLPESWAHAPKDVDLDEVITPQDALIVINAINQQTAEGITDGRLPTIGHNARVDVNGDGRLYPDDALFVINFLNTDYSLLFQPQSAAEGEASAAVSPDQLLLATDEIFSSLGSGKKR